MTMIGRWCEGPCGRCLPLEAFGPTHGRVPGIRSVCRRCVQVAHDYCRRRRYASYWRERKRVRGHHRRWYLRHQAREQAKERARYAKRRKAA